MSGVPAAERVSWRSDSCPPDQFGDLRRAFAADEAVDIVDLLCAHADEIMAVVERSWLDDHGIERGFSSH
ncbi:MAG TPA: hypothetical protein VMS92_15990 [Mycobacterium sp.]|nr:hypothetical protein [Mycobacterium sp.]